MIGPRVSVVIPNRDSPRVGDTIASVRRQTSLDRVAEIIVVGTDRPGLVDREHPVRFLDTGAPVTAPVARNTGMRAATGDILAFIDADCIASPGWLRGLLDAREHGHAVVGGGVAFPDRPYAQLCYNVTMFHDFMTSAPAGERSNLGTLNLLVNRSVIDDVGPMDEHLARGQDTEWTLRMRRRGHRLHFAPRAAVTHLPSVSSLGAVWRAWVVSGQYNGWIRSQYRDVIAVPPLYDHPALLTALSPAVAAAVTGRIFLGHPRLWRYAHTIPVVFATKVAWCLGASRRSLPAGAAPS